MRRLIVPLICSFLLPSAGVYAGKLGELEKRTLLLSPAVVYVRTLFKITATGQIEEEPFKMELNYGSSGSGFLYRPDGYLVTNGHVVADANVKDAQATAALQARIRHTVLNERLIPYLENKYQRKFTGAEDAVATAIKLKIVYTVPDLQVYLSNWTGYKAEIKAYSDPITGGGKDIAILKIDTNNLPTVKLGNSDTVHIQEPMTVIGYPGAASGGLIGEGSTLVPTVTNGHISALKVDFKGTPVIQSDAAITHGNSGGPAFNDASEVIGISTFGPEVAGFNFFVPVNTAMEFVRSVGATPQAGLFNSLWAEALDTYNAGSCVTATSKFDDVLRIMPNEPNAKRLAAQAQACIAVEPWWQKIMERAPWLLYVVGGVVLLGLLLIVIMAMSGKSKAPVPVLAAAGAGAGAGQVQAGRAEYVGQPGLPPGSSQAVASFGSIQVTSGSLSGKRFKLTKEGLLIGRDAAKCQVVFSEDTVSSEHAWIVPVDNGVVVIDRGSSNGTYINSTSSPKVSKVGLQNGDRVYLGKQGAAVLTYFSS